MRAMPGQEGKGRCDGMGAASGMPANPFLSDQQVGDLVNFVREVAYPQRLPADIRDTVYPAR